MRSMGLRPTVPNMDATTATPDAGPTVDSDLVMFRTGPHILDDLEHLRLVHGLATAGAIRYGTAWLLDWWRDSHPGEHAPARPGAHLPDVAMAAPDLIRFDHRPSDPFRRVRLATRDQWAARLLAALATQPVEDIYRHTICVARHVLDGGQGTPAPPEQVLDGDLR